MINVIYIYNNCSHVLYEFNFSYLLLKLDLFSDDHCSCIYGDFTSRQYTRNVLQRKNFTQFYTLISPLSKQTSEIIKCFNYCRIT